MSEQAVRHFHPHRLNALADGVFAIAMTLLASSRSPSPPSASTGSVTIG
jgi:hypothetical protein